ncbi:cysteine desulfurase [Acidiferrimicrobium sp. IK]|uniref:cysteine desulfurase family protein n=1 Tax=Acidiferrimicrobium sp. IK TaxID=2871700 RepID=UPI0021CB275D|nr:cysteine desulfurase family protein [Acidiferrimicrobium sp. IK]MCU4186515.1 cysteine desulfurase [Acidiferrimicrobium sp. IK]
MSASGAQALAPRDAPARVVYLDHAATTPVRPEARDAMLPWLTGRFGNPSGSHPVARAARTAVDDARDTVAGLLGVAPAGIVFTSGGTEADNLAVGGALRARPGAVVTTGAEHHAVLHAAKGFATDVRTVGLDGDGMVDMERLAAVLDDDVRVVSVMLVNNEIGTVQPLDRVAALVRRRAPHAVLHTDAVQAAAWLDLRTAAADADLISISAHKFGGPQGVGALAVRGGAEVAPIVFGGGQERERRSGTHNVAGIAGMAAALVAADASRVEETARVAAHRDRLADGLIAEISDARETGRRAAKVAGNCHLRFPGVESEALLVLLDEEGVCASAGSACASGALEPSHVLLAMGLVPADAASSIRFSLGWTTTAADIDAALRVVPPAVARLRAGR